MVHQFNCTCFVILVTSKSWFWAISPSLKLQDTIGIPDSRCYQGCIVSWLDHVLAKSLGQNIATAEFCLNLLLVIKYMDAHTTQFECVPHHYIMHHIDFVPLAFIHCYLYLLWEIQTTAILSSCRPNFCLDRPPRGPDTFYFYTQRT